MRQASWSITTIFVRQKVFYFAVVVEHVCNYRDTGTKKNDTRYVFFSLLLLMVKSHFSSIQLLTRMFFTGKSQTKKKVFFLTGKHILVCACVQVVCLLWFFVHLVLASANKANLCCERKKKRHRYHRHPKQLYVFHHKTNVISRFTNDCNDP